MSTSNAPKAAANMVNAQTATLRRWITLAGVALIVLIIAADGYEAWQDYRVVLAANQRSQLGLSRALAEQTARMMQTADVVISGFADWSISPEGRAASAAMQADRLRAEIKRLPFIYSASLAAADGRIVATTQDDADMPRNIEHRPAFAVPARAQDKALYIGQPFIGSRDGALTFVLSRGVHDAQGAFAGVVVARVAFDYLAAFYAGVDITPDTSIRLARQDGVVLAQYPRSDEAIADNFDGQPAYDTLHDSEQVRRDTGVDGRARIVALHRVQDYPMVVEVTRSLASVIKPWVHAELASALRTFSLALLAGMLLVVLRLALQRHERLERELANAQRAEALGLLAASVAHDFNNVLTAIVGYAELASKAVAADSSAYLNLQRLLAASERARLLVRQVLTFNPRRSVSYQPQALKPILAEVLQQLQATLPQTVRVQTSGLDQPATLIGDATEVYQVVMNLCVNAIHAMPDGGVLQLQLESLDVPAARTLAVGTVQPGRWLRLAIVDNGVGLTPQQQQLIFEPFYTTRAGGHGTGIGLTVVRNIIQRSGGALEVTSQPGTGTRMSVYWPRVEPPASTPIESAQPAALQGRGETILIVDDDVELVLLAEEMLASLGYEPVGFADARAALDAFRRDPTRFDAVLTDERMSPLRGCDLATFIHELAPAVPVILMTGHHDDDIDRRACQAGIATILDKPLRVETLRDALTRQPT